MPTFGEDEREGSSGLDSRPASPVENLSAITSHPQTCAGGSSASEAGNG